MTARLTGARLGAATGEEALEEVVDQQRQVFAPLAQRRQVDGQDVQPVEEVFAEAAVGDHLPQIALGAGDDAHVDGNRA